MRTCLIATLSVAAALAQVSPARAADESDLLTGYSLTSWNEADGHPLGSVHAIAQDRIGYLWIGTDAGLFRFDGSRFTPWNSIGDTPLPAVAVRALHVARDGSLWVGLADGEGIRHIRNDTVEDARDGLPSADAVTDIVEDGAGTMWTVSGRVLHSLRDRRWGKVTLPWKARDGLVLQPLLSSAGDLYVATRWGVFRRAAAGAAWEQLSGEFVWGLSEDSFGAIWTTDIVSGFRRLGTSARDQQLEGAGFRLRHDHRGNLWVATFGEGLWRVRNAGSAGGAVIEQAGLRTGLSSDSVQSLAEDRDGNIWVGTTGGLHRLTERKLTPVSNVGFVVAIERDEQSRVWAGTTNGVIRFAGSPTEWQRAGRGSEGLDIRSLYRDPGGTLWVGSTEGLWRLRDGRVEPVPIPGRAQMVIMSIAPDGRGGLWLGDGDWLFHWSDGRLTPVVLPPEAGTGPARITFARHDTRGRVWMGLAGGRLGLLDNGAFRLLGAQDGWTSAHTAIYSVIDDENDIVWIGGNGGLTRVAYGRAATVTQANGLPGGRVWALVEDRQRQLWLSMDRGIVRLDPGEVVRALEDPEYRMQYTLYDTHDGVAGAAIGVIHSVRATDGMLWFVRGGGVTVVDPATLAGERASRAAPVQVESVVANEERISPAALGRIPPGTRRIQFNYTALTLASSDRIRFRHRLEGFDNDWVDAGTRRIAVYTNLSPGDYRFQVEANAEDDWNTSSATWAFSIQPAFYQTSWFYGGLVLAVGLTLWGAWRVRLRLARRQFALALVERARLSREIHDTLLQSLVGVALQLDNISSSLGPSSVAARTQLTRVRRQVEAYIREARQSIWDLRSPVLEAHDVATALRDFGKQAVADTPIRFTASVSGSPYRCSSKIENQLLRIGQEAITNAIRHSRATRIQLELRFDHRAVTLRVIDDGRGFEIAHSAEDPERHYGLMTMRERAEELDGQFSLVSTAGRGTTIEAVIPTALMVREEVTAGG